MKKINILIVWTFLMTTLYAQEQTLTVDLSDPSKKAMLEAHLNMGTITVIGTDRKNILVKYSGKTHEDEEEDTDGRKDGLKKITGGSLNLEIIEDNNEVSIKSGSWVHEVNLTIEVPRSIDAKLRTFMGGDIILENVEGELEVNNFNGSLKASHVSGTMNVNTYNGDIEVVFDRVDAGKDMSFTNFNGEIDISLPHNYQGTFKMQSKWSEIYSDFEMTTSQRESKTTKEKDGKTYRVIMDDWTYASINGGGSEVLIKNYHGGIYIRKN